LLSGLKITIKTGSIHLWVIKPRSNGEKNFMNYPTLHKLCCRDGGRYRGALFFTVETVWWIRYFTDEGLYDTEKAHLFDIGYKDITVKNYQWVFLGNRLISFIQAIIGTNSYNNKIKQTVGFNINYGNIKGNNYYIFSLNYNL